MRNVRVERGVDKKVCPGRKEPRLRTDPQAIPRSFTKGQRGASTGTIQMFAAGYESEGAHVFILGH